MYEKYVELRDAKGATDYQVSQATGIAQSTFSDWKSGRSKPKLEKLILIARFFAVPLEFFIEE